MDYTHSFFAGTQPFQQQFIGVPPLTPSHSNSAGSDDYNTTSPPFAQQQHPVFSGPPTPPGQQLPQTVTRAAQPQSLEPPPQPQPQPPVTTSAVAPRRAGPTVSLDTQHAIDILPMTTADSGFDDITAQQQQDQSRRGGSNSDDDELTPAQSRRKAQNRAAQRAFRERKERHVKDLEAKLASLEAAQHKTADENERLKRDLQKISTENEILRATSSLQAAAAAAAGASPRMDGARGHAPLKTGPMTYNPTDFYTDLLAGHENKSPSHRIATSDSGERLLAAGAAWDLIISHDLFKRGLVDVANISNHLKTQAKCDGQGPVFEERAIIAAIEQSVGSGSDALL
ncbi:bzip transcription factor [Niveomyces insectorum RCEF 264]|uniref:Bzip transcription factor n=1 Tax=Niveomyces insectorum RCEF 264 TaxID=1081102 RepID=A0A167VCU7_9HYPO|nr:bzip transcription factor [Niveomyces insectorum RCEF 264]